MTAVQLAPCHCIIGIDFVIRGCWHTLHAVQSSATMHLAVLVVSVSQPCCQVNGNRAVRDEVSLNQGWRPGRNDTSCCLPVTLTCSISAAAYAEAQVPG